MKSDPRWRISARAPCTRQKKKKYCQHIHPDSKTHNRRCLRVATSRHKQTGNGEAKWNQLFEIAALTRLQGGDRGSQEEWGWRWGLQSSQVSWSLSPCSFNYRQTAAATGEMLLGGGALFWEARSHRLPLDAPSAHSESTTDTTTVLQWHSGGKGHRGGWGHQTSWVIIRAVCSAPHYAVCIHRRGPSRYPLPTRGRAL